LAAILVVEDNLLLSVDISEALKDGGYDVLAVANADEAIKSLKLATTFAPSSQI
jgi:CheY-like chemotaxis protein